MMLRQLMKRLKQIAQMLKKQRVLRMVKQQKLQKKLRKLKRQRLQKRSLRVVALTTKMGIIEERRPRLEKRIQMLSMEEALMAI